MIVAIDCGNSYTKVGIFKGKKFIKFFAFPSKEISKFKIPEDFKKYNIDHIGIGSVNQEVSEEIKKIFFTFFQKNIVEITPDMCKIPLKIKNKKKVGVDRILNCKAASVLYGYPCIVIDIGTAITLDVINQKGEFEGGIIFPGPDLILESLTRTSLMKRVSFLKKDILIGKNTDECITSGINNGIVGFIEKSVSEIVKIYKNPKVIMTGGWADYFSPKIKFKKFIKKNLTLEGINIVLRENER